MQGFCIDLFIHLRFSSIFPVEVRGVNRGGGSAWGVTPPYFRKIGGYAPLLLKISFFLVIKIEKKE
jgi:hypothetical protein